MDVILSCLKILVSLLYPDFFPRVNIAFTSKFLGVQNLSKQYVNSIAMIHEVTRRKSKISELRASRFPNWLPISDKLSQYYPIILILYH